MGKMFLNFLFILLWIPSFYAQESCKGEYEFLCNNGDCIKKEYLCDGSKECSDGSDETTDICKHRSCSKSLDYENLGGDDFIFPSVATVPTFKCAYGACISKNFVCDGIRHCVADGSDETEEQCSSKKCESREFKCNYGACLSRSNVCDNRFHCVDGSDETEEACRWRRRSRCYRGRFRCSYGSCIRKGKNCDGVYDCLDGSDESIENCGKQRGLLPFNQSQIYFSNEFIFKSRYPPSATTELPTSSSQNPPIQDNSEAIDGCRQTNNYNIRLDILFCPDESGCQEQVIPTGTVMLIHCEAMPSPLECKADGKWHFLRDPTKTPRSYPCQGEDSSAPDTDDGIVPIQRDLPKDCGLLPIFSPMPWLVGLFRSGKFSCTGTLINPSLVLTAAHCVVRNQVSNNLAMNKNNLRIQFYSRTPNDEEQYAYVLRINIHPKYIGGSTPKYDMALIFLKEDLAQRNHLPSACLDEEGSLLNVQAWTFNRTEGEWPYGWDSFPQTLDTSCINKATKCSRHLNIGENQFCSVNKGSLKYLHPGSSGGPYFINKTQDGVTRWKVAGVVSNSVHTSECGIPHTVFTSVSKLYSWIVDCGFRGNC